MKVEISLCGKGRELITLSKQSGVCVAKAFQILLAVSISLIATTSFEF